MRKWLLVQFVVALVSGGLVFSNTEDDYQEALAKRAQAWEERHKAEGLGEALSQECYEQQVVASALSDRVQNIVDPVDFDTGTTMYGFIQDTIYAAYGHHTGGLTYFASGSGQILEGDQIMESGWESYTSATQCYQNALVFYTFAIAEFDGGKDMLNDLNDGVQAQSASLDAWLTSIGY